MGWRIFVFCVLLLEPEYDRDHTLDEPKPQTQITVSKENTHFTSPLDKEGYPDVISYFNERDGKDVSPEKNFVVGFWQAIGTGELPLDGENAERYFKELGIERPEEKQSKIFIYDYIRSQTKDMEEAKAEELKKKFETEFDAASQGPWKREQYPFVAGWIDQLSDSTANLQKVFSRTQYYSPFVNYLSIARSDYSDVAYCANELSRAFKLTALRYIGEGDHRDALQITLNMHKLTHQLGNSSSPDDRYIIRHINSEAREIERLLLRLDCITGKEWRDYQAQLAELQPLESVVVKVRNFDPYRWVAICVKEAKNEKRRRSEFRSPTIQKLLDALPGMNTGHNWNLVLKKGHQRFHLLMKLADSISEADLDGDSEARIKSARAKLKEFDSAEYAKPNPALLLIFPDALRTQRSFKKGLELIDIYFFSIALTMNLEKRDKLDADLFNLAVALLSYKDHELTYPTKLQDLVPKYIKVLPEDSYNKNGYSYHGTRTGCVVYSVFKDGKDNDGFGWYDAEWNSEIHGDDNINLGIRLGDNRPNVEGFMK